MIIGPELLAGPMNQQILMDDIIEEEELDCYEYGGDGYIGGRNPERVISVTSCFTDLPL